MRFVMCPNCKVNCKPYGHLWFCPVCGNDWWRAPMDSRDYGMDVLVDVTEYEQEEEDAD